jgi:predicted permease
MISVLVQMGLLILCGVAWRIIRPGGLDADQTRLVLTTVVFNLLLPALVLSVLWQASIGLETLKISLFGTAIISFGAFATWLISWVWRINRKQLGAAMLAIAFPNVTYLGLPLLEQTFGPWARSIVIQIDLFAGTPLLLTLGILIARHYGDTGPSKQDSMLRSLLVNPPVWSAVLALALNFNGAPPPPWLDQLLDKLSAAVIPLMLISLGLGLSWHSWHYRNVPVAAVVLALKLAVMPIFGFALASELGFGGDKLSALVLEAGMPSMLLGVVYCDRYRLDTAFYAMAVALTTLCSMISLPFLHQQLSGL